MLITFDLFSSLFKMIESFENYTCLISQMPFVPNDKFQHFPSQPFKILSTHIVLYPWTSIN
jgi:hypothetical protein